MIPRQLCASLLFVTFAACSSSGGDAAPEDSAVDDTLLADDTLAAGDASTSTDANGDVTVAADAKSDGDAAADTRRDSSAFDTAIPDHGSADTTPPPGSCNTLSPATSVANYRRVAGPPPAAAGGTVLDGDYMAVEIVQYDTGVDSLSPSLTTERLVIAGAVAQEVIEPEVGKPPVWSTYSVATSGTTFTMTKTCASAVPASPMTYTATATRLTLYYRASGKNWAVVLERAP